METNGGAPGGRKPLADAGSDLVGGSHHLGATGWQSQDPGLGARDPWLQDLRFQMPEAGYCDRPEHRHVCRDLSGGRVWRD